MRLLLSLASGFALAAPADAAPCRVTGELTAEVTVRPGAGAPFDVGVWRTPATAELPARVGQPAAVTVLGDLRFRAEIARPEVSLAREVVSLDGMAHLRRGARLLEARGSRDGVRATVVMASTHGAPEVLFRDVALPCDALTLDDAEDIRIDKRDAEEEADFALYDGFRARAIDRWRTIGDRWVTLRARPEVGAPHHFLFATFCEQRFGLISLARRGEWLEVAQFGEEAVVRGFIRERELEPYEYDGTPVDPPKTCAPRPDRRQGRPVEQRADDLVGEARLSAGARIFAAAGRGEWARVARATEVKILWRRGARWVAVLHVDGLYGIPDGDALWNAFAARDPITLIPLEP